MANPTVGIDIVARLDQFKAEMAKLGPEAGTAGRAIAAQLSKEIKAAEKASRDAAKAARDSAGAHKAQAVAVKGVADGAGDAATALGKIAASVSTINEPLSRAIQTMVDFADGTEVAAQAGNALGLSFGSAVAVAGSVAVALAGLTAAYVAIAGDIERAAAEQEAYREISASLVPTLRAVEDAQRDLAVATGQLSEARAREEQAAANAQRAVSDFGKAQRDQREELRATIDTANQWIDALTVIVPLTYNPFAQATDAVFGWSDSIESANNQLAALDAAVVEEAANQAALREATQDLARETTQAKQADDSAAEAKRQASEAARRAADALRELSAEMERNTTLAEQNAAAFGAQVDALDAAAQASILARLDGEEKIEAQLAQTIARYEEMRNAALAVATTTEARETAEQAFQRATTEATRTADAEIDRIEQAAFDKRMAELDKLKESQESLAKDVVEGAASYMIDGLGQINAQVEESYQKSVDNIVALQEYLAAGEDVFTDTQKKELRERIEAQKQAALEAWNTSKALKVAEAVAATALAVANALASSPPPFNAVTAAIAAASGAAQVAAIESTTPAFNDTPGVQQMGTRGNVSLAAGDYFAAARNPEDLQRQVGAVADNGPVQVLFRYDHKVYDMGISNTIRRGGRTSREIATLTRTGPTGHGSR